MSSVLNEPDSIFWKSYVVDAEYQAELNDDDHEASDVFHSFLSHWLDQPAHSKITLYFVPSFKDNEFLITPDAEFYVSSLLGGTIKNILAEAKNRKSKLILPASFVITNS